VAVFEDERQRSAGALLLARVGPLEAAGEHRVHDEQPLVIGREEQELAVATDADELVPDEVLHTLGAGAEQPGYRQFAARQRVPLEPRLEEATNRLEVGDLRHAGSSVDRSRAHAAIA
jgi:hypothetical protein